MIGNALQGLRLEWILVACLAVGCGVEEIERAPRPQTGGPPSPAVAPPDAATPATPAAPVTPATPPEGRIPDAARPPLADAGADASAPTTPAVGVTIGGTFVPREKAIVVLHLGHSNMAGRALGPPELKPYFYGTDPHLWRYQKGGRWTPALEPLSGDGGYPGGPPQGAGPGMALLRQGLAADPGAYLISIGQGESVDFDGSCFTFRKGGLFYELVAGPARELKGKVTFAGLFVMLGYDGRTYSRAKNGGYIACLQGLAADFRAELDEPDLPYIQNDYERGATGVWSPTSPGAPAVIAVLAQVPAAIPRSVLVPTDGITMQDDHHFNMTGHQMWAQRVFMLLGAHGLMPWAPAP